MTQVEQAVAELQRGHPVVMPTDTVYGLAAPISDLAAVRALFDIKGRTQEKAIPLLAARLEDLLPLVDIDGRARLLGERFWPGPLTLVVRRRPEFDVWLGDSARESVAVRIPDCKIARAVLYRTGPLAVTSANRSGSAPASTVEEARRSLTGVSFFLDDGPRRGSASTVVSLVAEPEVLREGPLPATEVIAVLATASRGS